MNSTQLRLEAGGLVSAKTKLDSDATERIAARSYSHPALGNRPVVRLVSERLGSAEDLAMEFLGFQAPRVSKAIAVQHRRSLGFAAWALIHDPQHAQYALDLVKRMKAAARLAKSKPGHAWDVFTEMATELGRSAPHFLPVFWEDAGRTYKDLGNQNYGGRALNKSLQAERVHALESDRPRRRDVVLEFALAGCLAGKALTEYTNDLASQYSPDEAYQIFRDLCNRRTRGGMAPWSTLAKDFTKMAKAANLNADAELELWLEEVMESPAMGRAPMAFWNSCQKRIQRLVDRNPAFAVGLLRLTNFVTGYESWLAFLQECGVFSYLWRDQHNGSPALGQPIADWFSPVINAYVPTTALTLEMLDKLTPRLLSEGKPLALNYHIDVDVLETCLARGIAVNSPRQIFELTFSGWLSVPDHSLRNLDIRAVWDDDRFAQFAYEGLVKATMCRGGEASRGWRQKSFMQRPFPQAAGDKLGVRKQWKRQFQSNVNDLIDSGCLSFGSALLSLEQTLWPEALQYFPDEAEQLRQANPACMLQKTLQVGVIEEYGWPELESLIQERGLDVSQGQFKRRNFFVCFPEVLLSDGINAVAFGDRGERTWELRLPPKATLIGLVPVNDDLCIAYQNANTYQTLIKWASDPDTSHQVDGYFGFLQMSMSLSLPNGGVFFGERACFPGDSTLPKSDHYFSDGQRVWRFFSDFDQKSMSWNARFVEVDPQTGSQLRDSVPAWFEEIDDGELNHHFCELIPAPRGTEDSLLGCKQGMLGWRVTEKRDGNLVSEGIDGRRWEKQLFFDHHQHVVIGLLKQAASSELLPISTDYQHGGAYGVCIWDADGETVALRADSSYRSRDHGTFQSPVLPLRFWHYLRPRDEASSKILRHLSLEQAEALLEAGRTDLQAQIHQVTTSQDNALSSHPATLAAVKKLLPAAPVVMQNGVAATVVRATKADQKLTQLLERMSKLPDETDAVLAGNRELDHAAEHWHFGSAKRVYDSRSKSVSEHMAATAKFLKGDIQAVELPKLAVHWFRLLRSLAWASWDAFVRHSVNAKENAPHPLDLLDFFIRLGLLDLPGKFHAFYGHPVGATKTSYGMWEVDSGGKSFGFRQGENAFVVAPSDIDEQPFLIIRYSTSDEPSLPEGYVIDEPGVAWELNWTADQAREFCQAARTANQIPLPGKSELQEAAEAIAISPAELALVWLGPIYRRSHRSQVLPTDLREALGLKANEVKDAAQSLTNLGFEVCEKLFAAAVSIGPVAVFADDRRPALAAIQQVWQQQMPNRIPLDAALQKKVSAMALGSEWSRYGLQPLMESLAAPADSPHLAIRPMKIVYDSWAKIDSGSPPFDDRILTSIVHLIAVVHSECPGGDGARTATRALFQQTLALLADEATMLHMAHASLDDPATWPEQLIGKTEIDGPMHLNDGGLMASAHSESHGALVVFRPALLRGQAELDRVLGMLHHESAYSQHWDAITATLLLRSPGFSKLVDEVEHVPTDVWPQDPLHTVPELVATVAERHEISENAAVLYLQMLALPDPATANLRKWNNWKPTPLKKASVELLEKSLVMEAKRARAGRTIFLPGEWLELKAPWLPIESWKAKHLADLDLTANLPLWPAGGPLVLRPFADVFQAAWERTQSGDAPDYEEVQIKKKRK